MVLKSSGILKVWVDNPQAHRISLKFDEIEEIKFEEAKIQFMGQVLSISWGDGWHGKWIVKIRSNGNVFATHIAPKPQPANFEITNMRIGKIFGIEMRYFKF